MGYGFDMVSHSSSALVASGKTLPCARVLCRDFRPAAGSQSNDCRQDARELVYLEEDGAVAFQAPTHVFVAGRLGQRCTPTGLAYLIREGPLQS